MHSVDSHYSLDWTTGPKFFPFFGQDSVLSNLLLIFDTWRPQLFLKTIDLTMSTIQ